VIVILFLVNLLSVNRAMISYIMMPFVGFFVGTLITPRGFIYVKKENSVNREFFNFNIWVALFSAITALSSRLDIFISASLLTTTQLGLYGAANQLTQVIPQLVSALGTVVAPKMSSMGNVRELFSYFKKTQIFVLGLAIGGFMLLPILLFFIPIIYGASYSEMIGPFCILFSAMMIFLISVPIHNSIIYYFSYPKLFVWLSLLNLGVMVLVGSRMIYFYGPAGASLSVLIVNIINIIVPGIWFTHKLKRMKTRL
jgi:O-antigen/teichoic acid export membrane protein